MKINYESLIENTLVKVFGFKSFKGEQKQIILSVIQGDDSLVIMPTGGGKSLCYQLPALIKDGTAVVISPLIALMKNQVDNFRGYVEKESIAHVLNSSLSSTEINQVFSDVKNKKTKLLYMAPESFAKKSNIDFLKSVNISFLAVDEAHCISEWGHDFRPEYRNLRQTLDEISPKSTVIALTATATEKVQLDIIKNLKIQNVKKFKSSFNRPNLYYEVRFKDENINYELLKFIKKNEGKSGIIYCLSRKKVDEISEFLKLNNINAMPYHAGLEKKIRNQNQDSFLMQDIDVIVATIAFGMGIDKPDIRYVIHYDIPKSLEGYYQETGRAGRDGGDGHCLAFYSEKDVEKLKKFMSSKPKTEKDLSMLLLEEVVGYCKSTVSRRKYILKYFDEKFDSISKDGHNMDDNIRIQDSEKTNVKDELLTLLNLLNSVNSIYTQKILVNILMGEMTSILNSHNIETNFYFSKGKYKDEDFWNNLIWHAITEGMINKKIEDYGNLNISSIGLEFLKSPFDFFMLENINKIKLNGSQHNKDTAADKELINLLKKLRKTISENKSIPPYIVFQDISLNEMSLKYPTTLQELSTIHGVGEGKARRFGDKFITLINDYINKNNIVKPDDIIIKTSGKKSSLKLFIIQSLDRKLSLDDIADAKSISINELIEEMESIVLSGTKINLDFCVEQYLDDDQQDDLKAYFLNSEIDNIDQCFLDLSEEFDEFEIRLYRIKFLSDLAN
jgi:ATP-dependent DNA helicase RecQ